MSSDRRPGARSHATDRRRRASSPAPSSSRSSKPPALGEASLVAVRGDPLVAALDARVPGAGEHSDAVAGYAFATAVELHLLDRASCELVREAARLHDVGELYARSALIGRGAGQLSRAELVELDGHAESGYRLALGAGIPERVCAWIRCSRERWDGRGGRLAGEEIPLASRIIRAACACDVALKAAAPWGRRHAAAVTLRAAAGDELDPLVASALAEVIERATADAAAR
jgi:HD-GYP domain-containing protein (c-di-GMP phosphodiesterase class II)